MDSMIPLTCRFSPVVAAVMFSLVAAGCSRGAEARPAGAVGTAAATPAPGVPAGAGDAPSASAGTPSAARPAIVFLGTSLTAAYGLDPALGYPAHIQAKLDSMGLAYDVVNAGVSGETSPSARRRLGWLLRERKPALLVLEVGANDGLRGMDTDSLRANLLAMIAEARAQPVPPKILLVGMRSLPNLGRAYAQRFESVYPAVAKQADVPLLPFLLEGVAGVEKLNQTDGVHPTAEGQTIIGRTVWTALEPLLR